MLQAVSGTVREFRPISSYSVQVFLNGSPNVIELYVSSPWVIHRRDDVAFTGEFDPATGKFIAYAYANMTCRVFGQSVTSPGGGMIFIVASIFFCWAIFPLFFHLPEGIRQVKYHKKVTQAVQLLYSHLQSQIAPSLSVQRKMLAQQNK